VVHFIWLVFCFRKR